MTIKQAMETMNFDDFYNAVLELNGNWDEVNSTDTIKMYINDMMSQGINVSHILEAIEEYNPTEMWRIWLGNSMETPEPITTNQELVDALELDINQEI